MTETVLIYTFIFDKCITLLGNICDQILSRLSPSDDNICRCLVSSQFSCLRSFDVSNSMPTFLINIMIQFHSLQIVTLK